MLTWINPRMTQGCYPASGATTLPAETAIS